MTLNIRKLTAAEVTFEITLEPEDTDPRGNYLCTDEPELDRAAENEIIERLNNGEVEAWCGVVVTARWVPPIEPIPPGVGIGRYAAVYVGQRQPIEGGASIWGCSFAPDNLAAQIEETVEAHGLREEALDELNAQLELMARRLAPLVAE